MRTEPLKYFKDKLSRVPGTLWWLDVVYPLAFFTCILLGMTFFVFDGQSHRKISTLVEHQFLSTILPYSGTTEQANVAASQNQILHIHLAEGIDSTLGFKKILSQLEEKAKVMSIIIDTSLWIQEEAFVKQLIKSNKKLMSTYFISSQTANKLVNSPQPPFYEIQFCGSVDQIICPFYKKAKSWNVQHIIEKHTTGHLTKDSMSFFYRSRFAENIGSNFPSYILRLPKTKKITTNIKNTLASIKEDWNEHTTLFVQISSKNAPTNLHSIPSFADTHKALPVEFWAGLVALSKSNSFISVGTRSLEWIIAILILLCIGLVSFRFGFLAGLAAFTSALLFLPFVIFTLLKIANFYLPVFLIEYVLLMSFIGLGFFLSASESLMHWIQSTKRNLSDETKDLLENFISLISHNLNTPVAKTIGLLDVMQRLPSSPELSNAQKQQFKTVFAESMFLSTQIQISVKNTLADSKLEMAKTGSQVILLSELAIELELKLKPIFSRFNYKLEVKTRPSFEKNQSTTLSLPFPSSYVENLALAGFSLLSTETKKSHFEKILLTISDMGELSISLLDPSNASHQPVDEVVALTGSRILENFRKSGLADYEFIEKDLSFNLKIKVNEIHGVSV